MGRHARVACIYQADWWDLPDQEEWVVKLQNLLTIKYTRSMSKVRLLDLLPFGDTIRLVHLSLFLNALLPTSYTVHSAPLWT